jgi:hypothetical protein
LFLVLSSRGCGLAMAPAASTMSGAIFQPLAMILLMSGWYFVVILSVVSTVNLSLQYVNSINCVVIYGVGASGGGWLYGWPRMCGLSLALWWHLWVPHVHGICHVGNVFSWGSSLYVPVFISM